MQVNHYEFSGKFKLTVRKAATMEIVKETDFIDNIITNSGLDALGVDRNNLFAGCTVGSGTAPEQATDVSIGNFVARTGAVQAGLVLANGSSVSPYYAKATITWRFAEGEAEGNITEVGVIHYWDNSIFPLWSRTLIKDAGGNPVTITILSDEILDVTYEARVYYQETAITGTTTLIGNNYDYKIVSSDMTGVQAANCFVYGLLPKWWPNSRCLAFDGPLSAPPANSPTGSQIGYLEGPSAPLPPYVQGSYKITAMYKFAPGNGTGSIKSLALSGYFGRAPAFGVELNPAFNKTEAYELTVGYTISWGRKTLP